MFRKMRPAGEKVVREEEPRVTLHVEPRHQRSAELADTLNYEERDDQLVATLHRFAKENPDADARLLTHDTTPLYTAEGIGLKAERIPENWLLDAERDEQTKKVDALQQEVARLRRAEPSFNIRFLNTTGSDAESFEVDVDLYDPLTNEEVGKLMERLRRRHPVKTDFGPPDAEHPLGGQLSRTLELGRLAVGRVYDAPSDENVAKYRDEAYPDWLSGCEQTLSVLHHLLQQREPMARFCFSVVNGGTRPAAGALVTIEARGKFRTMAARDSIDSEPIRLPEPPKPPQGKWRNPFDFAYDLRAAVDPSLFPRESLVDALRPAPPRDPNGFYHKSHKPLAPADSFSLSCEQWRHADGRKDFFGEVSVPPGSGDVEGAVKIRIQAENLSEPATRTVLVRIRTRNVSSHTSAVRLVDLVGEEAGGSSRRKGRQTDRCRVEGLRLSSARAANGDEGEVGVPEHGVRSGHSGCPFELLTLDRDGVISSATGFFVDYENVSFVVTNWPVVSGKHFVTKRSIDSAGRCPTRVLAKLATYDVGNRDRGEFGIAPFEVELYRSGAPPGAASAVHDEIKA